VREELLAFNAGETTPTFGNLLTLPVDDGLLYVQPVYAVRQLSDASYPILQFVIVSYGGRVGIGNSLEQALGDVLGVDPGDIPDETEPGGNGNGNGNGQPEPAGSPEEQIVALLAQAQTAFDEADQAYRDGDPVLAAEKTEEARGYIEEAFTISDEAGLSGGEPIEDPAAEQGSETTGSGE
jgi:uncharacterized membrane protein (UPF0182 family)